MRVDEAIRRKRDGEALPQALMRLLMDAIARGEAADAQVGAFAMAAYLQGLTREETIAMTLGIRDSGAVLDWRGFDLPGPVVDKHSTGGVGDCVSLVLAPMLAACGAFVPMISGRGLGHTGGTLDKLEAIPGYDTRPEPERFQRIVAETGAAIVGQSEQLAPADRRLYAVRDVTATVDSRPLIVASILGKKLACSLDSLVLDVKTGNGALMPEPQAARALARALCEVGTGAGTPSRALITDMDQPLARAAGNALEVRECLDVLSGRIQSGRLRELSIELGAELLLATSLAPDRRQARARLRESLERGDAAERFARMTAALGGPRDLLERYESILPEAPFTLPLPAPRSGFVQSVATRAIGEAVIALGGGRQRGDEGIDPAVGLSALREPGAAVEAGEPLAQIHARSSADAEQVRTLLAEAITLGDHPAEGVSPLVHETLGELVGEAK